MKRLSLTTWSILALAVGLGLGILGNATGAPFFDRAAEWTKAVGNLWISALQLTVLPLVITNLLAAICGAGVKFVGKLGVRVFVLFIGLLIAAGTFAILLTPLFLSRLPVDPGITATLIAAAESTKVSGSSTALTNAPPVSISEWVGRLLPTNLLEAGMRGDILPLLLFTALFALAVTQLPADKHLLLANVFQALAEAMMQLVRWILIATPIGVFALTYVLALKTGVSMGGLLGAYVVIASLIMVLFTLLLYPLSVFAGRTTIREFARGVAPAQLVAISTRSSIASLPALIEGARDRLRLPSSATSFLLPLSVSVFKVNRPISSIVKLMLVAHLYGVDLTPTKLTVFLVTVVLISFTAPGIPQSGPGFKTIPAYLAAGVPIEGILVLEAIESIPDIFKTLLNVTGDMSVATLLTGSERLQTQETDFDTPTAAEGAV